MVDRTGASQTLSLRPNSYAQPRFSPKGDKLVFWIQQLRCWIEVYDLTRGSMRRITSEGDNHHPVWTADGQTRGLHLEKNRHSRLRVFSKATNNGSAEDRLSPDGQFINQRAAQLVRRAEAESACQVRMAESR
jgi:Tol biopolymer transport system component